MMEDDIKNYLLRELSEIDCNSCGSRECWDCSDKIDDINWELLNSDAAHMASEIIKIIKSNI